MQKCSLCGCNRLESWAPQPKRHSMLEASLFQQCLHHPAHFFEGVFWWYRDHNFKVAQRLKGKDPVSTVLRHDSQFWAHALNTLCKVGATKQPCGIGNYLDSKKRLLLPRVPSRLSHTHSRKINACSHRNKRGGILIGERLNLIPQLECQARETTQQAWKQAQAHNQDERD